MLLLVGPSASGKTEIAKMLEKKYHLSKVITYTTRKQREHETNHVDYHFISMDEFAKLNENNFFVETTYYNANFYGTARQDVTDEKCIILDPNGLKNFLALKDSHIISFFLSCDENLRFKRMILRNDAFENAKKRIMNDRIAFHEKNMAGVTFVVDSDTLSVEQLTDKIFNMYQNVLQSLR